MAFGSTIKGGHAMMSLPLVQSDGVLKRAMWLFGLHSVLNDGTFLLGFYLLPQGLMRSSPAVGVGGAVAQAGSFWTQLGLTLLFNLGVMTTIIVLCNLNRVRTVPVGYLIPITLGITGGLISGTNSFAASDLTRYNAWEGLALGLGIGGLEMLAYVLVAAATANLTVYQYRSWWRWSGEWQATQVRRFRDLRLTRSEVVTLGIGVLLFLIAAYRETVFSFAS
jgi:hypothetical protein